MENGYLEENLHVSLREAPSWLVGSVDRERVYGIHSINQDDDVEAGRGAKPSMIFGF